jgi:DHA2 family multidrug resistance protein-like MFS transporter
MTAAAQPATVEAGRAWRPDDRWLLGVVLAVITFWLFAQTLLNVIPAIQGSLGLDTTVANLAVSVTALMSGLFIVVLGGLADRAGRGTILRLGVALSIVGSLLIVLTPTDRGALTATTIMAGRIVQGLSAACVMPSSLALIKDFYDDDARARALSFWSIGSWGGSGFCALFGGLMAVSVFGWRSIFFISIAVALLALYLTKDTPVSKVDAPGDNRFDWSGLVAFVVAMLAINVFISQGPRLGWFSGASLALVSAFVVATLVFFRLEPTKASPFVDLSIFDNKTFAGATLSNFLLNGSAGTLVVSLGLVQRAAGWSSLQSGLLTIGYLVAILATIRVGERLLQRHGPKKPMMWGTAITAAGILMTSCTFLLIDQYAVVAFIGFVLYGIGLGFYATPSTDAAMSSVSNDKAGAAAGIYKMASSLGSAFGVAISAAIYTAAQHLPAQLVPNIFWGRQDNVAMRFGGGLGLLFNIFMCVVALISIMVAVPDVQPEEQRDARLDVPATPSFGS